MLTLFCSGDDVQFTAKIEGEPEISWYKGNTLLADEGRYVIVDLEEDQIFTLAIEDLLPEDEGEYRCVAVNEAGKSESVAKLLVRDHEYPPEFTSDSHDEPYFANKGDDLRLDVTLKGKPSPDVKWFLDDKPLRNNIHYEMSEDGNQYSLCIRSVTFDDKGVYKCEASSDLGKVIRKFQVNLQGEKVCNLYCISTKHKQKRRPVICRYILQLLNISLLLAELDILR